MFTTRREDCNEYADTTQRFDEVEDNVFSIRRPKGRSGPQFLFCNFLPHLLYSDFFFVVILLVFAMI